MKITTTKSALQSGLSFLSGIPVKGPMPILQNVLVSKQQGIMSFVASSIEVESTANVQTDGNEEFAFTVNYQKLSDIVSKIAEEAKTTIDIDDGKITIKSGRSKFNMQTLPADDFPKIELSSPISGATLDQAELKKLLQSVAKAMAIKDVRYFLNGALFEIKDNVLSVVGTDGGALSVNSIPVQASNVSAILPYSTVMRLIKLLNTGVVHIEFYSQKMRLMIDGNEIITNLIDGKYPEYQRVIPTNHKHSTNVDKARFIASCKIAAISTNDRFRAIKLTFSKQLTFSGVAGAEESSDNFDVNYDGPDIEIGFNVDYLIDAAESIVADTFSISFNDEKSSIMLQSDEFKAVIMPTRNV
jgi:DNA polymerase-3 subunit beta